MLTVGQVIVELEELDQEAPCKVHGGNIVEIETTDDNNVLISGEYDGIK
jgi:hypothetical protein